MTLIGAGGSPPDVTVLVPAKDEAGNLERFVTLFEEALRDQPATYELVVIDDGSTDGTADVLARLQTDRPWLHVATHRRQRGIADALRTGYQRARGRILVFYPADLQFLPGEIPTLTGPILADEADVVTGTKQGNYNKAFVSGIYNRLCRWLFGVRVSDLNAVKAYRTELMSLLPNRPDWHRFMVVIAAVEGFRIAERPVTLYPRHAGQSKFGLGRIPIGMTDLLSVWFQLRFGRKPMLFFGVSGGILFALGFLVGVAALVARFGYGVGFRPLLNLVMVLVISGIALFGFGFVGEMLAGTREEIRSLHDAVDQLRSDLGRTTRPPTRPR